MYIFCGIYELPQVTSAQVEPDKQPTGSPQPGKRAIGRHTPNIKNYFHSSMHAECEGVASAKRLRKDSRGELKGEEYPDEVVEMCKECGEQVPVWLVGEHTDYHLALQLQRDKTEWEQVPTVAKRSGQAGRRGQVHTSTSIKPMTIDRFFHKK